MRPGTSTRKKKFLRHARNTSDAEFNANWDETEQTIKFEMSWEKNPNAARRFYPVYELKQPAEKLKQAAILEFEAKSVQDKVENDFNYKNFMLVYP